LRADSEGLTSSSAALVRVRCTLEVAVAAAPIFPVTPSLSCDTGALALTDLNCANKMIAILPRMLDAVHAYNVDFNVVVGFVLGALLVLTLCAKFGRQILTRALRRITRAKLRFETHERGTVWFGVIADQRYLVSLKAVWKVTNASKQSVTLKSFYVNGLATDHHMLSLCGLHDDGVLIPPRKNVDIEIFCMVQKTLTWGSGTFIADIGLIDDRGDVRIIKNVRFNYLKQTNSSSPPYATRDASSQNSRDRNLDVVEKAD
jgi:hypothetical protein